MKDKIISQIRANKLDGSTKEFIIAQLCVLNNKPFADVKKIVDKLVANREITVADNGNQQQGNFYNPSVDKKQKSRIVINQKSKTNPRRLEGKIQGTRKGYAFLIPADIEQEDVFIAAKDLKGAMHNDKVLIEVFYAGKKREGRVLNIIERGNGLIVGKINLDKRNAYVTPDDVKFGRDILVPINRTLGANEGDKVVVKIERFAQGKKSPEGVVTEVLGSPHEIETQILAVLRSFGLFETFPNKVQEYAKTLPTEVVVSKNIPRKDLTKELIFTIDGDDTRDIDDAISLKILDNGNRLLGVHIADVGEYVRWGSTIDNEAFKRGTSVYLPNLVLPMLPRELSNGICSLNPDVVRLALSAEMEINGKGDVVSHKIFESLIKSKKQFTYNEVTKIFKGDKKTLEANKIFVDTLLEMNKLAKVLAAKRTRNGALNFDLPEPKFILSETGDVVDVKPRESEDSHKLIESFMIAANETIAKHFFDKKTPFLYRVHEKPDPEKIGNFLRLVRSYGVKAEVDEENIQPKDLQKALDTIANEDYAYGLNRICLRSQKKAKYMPQCLGHFGLASKFYTHFTSPIRRYPDLTIHRIIKDDLRGQMNGKKLTETKQFVVASGYQSSDREVNAEKVEREVDDIYRALYMNHHIGEEFDAIISGVTSFGIFVELENTVEGLVSLADLPYDSYSYNEADFVLKGNKQSYRLGDKVRAKCISVNMETHDINFVLV